MVQLGDLAWTYRVQGRLWEAEQLQMQVYTTLSAVRGPEHLHTLLSMADLARIYREQCRTSEAEALQREVMDKSLRTLGADHSEPLSSIVNLSSIVRAAADLLRTDDPARTLKLAEAQDLQIIALEKASRITGARSPTTMLHIASPAGIYDLQSQWARLSRSGHRSSTKQSRPAGRSSRSATCQTKPRL